MFWTTKVLKLLIEIVALLKQVLKVVRLKKPGMVFIRIVSEDGKMLKFVLDLPAPGASDVVKRELSVRVGSADVKSIELDGAALVTEELEGADNDSVDGQLIDIDDAGNRSEASSFSFVLTDTIPPPAPGAVGLRVTAEV